MSTYKMAVIGMYGTSVLRGKGNILLSSWWWA